MYMSYKYLKASAIVEHFQQQLAQLRTGRVNSAILDHILVEVYGSKMKIQELATITTPEASQLLISPFDKGVVSAIEKAIQNSNLGVNPMNDGAGVRLNFPPLNEETRKARVKEVKKLLEDAKIAVRNDRQQHMKSWKNLKDEGEISEDEIRDNEKALQAEVEKLNEELESMSKTKEVELMKV
jgi:ribosome recycling factor